MPKPILALITIIATLAYLGLAVLGFGGFAAFFSHSALIALTIVLFALSGVSIFSSGNLSPGVREDRANRWVIIAFGLIGLVAAYLPA
jgi:ABC-type transport system involved in cytochrome c biogenesis permease subunit